MARDHHYRFAHRSLPGAFHPEPEQFLEVLSTEGDDELRSWWQAVAESLEDPREKVAPEGLTARVSWSERGNFVIALITLPIPVAATEAYFVAAVYQRGRSDKAPRVQRFVTLEYARLDPDDCSAEYRAQLEELARSTGVDPFAPSTQVGEWTREGCHCTYAGSPPPDADAFLEAVHDLIAGRPPYEEPASAMVPPS